MEPNLYVKTQLRMEPELYVSHQLRMESRWHVSHQLRMKWQVLQVIANRNIEIIREVQVSQMLQILQVANFIQNRWLGCKKRGLEVQGAVAGC